MGRYQSAVPYFMSWLHGCRCFIFFALLIPILAAQARPSAHPCTKGSLPAEVNNKVSKIKSGIALHVKPSWEMPIECRIGFPVGKYSLDL